MKTKLFGALFCLAFMIGFGFGGYTGVSSLWGHAEGWFVTRSWQPVPAQVVQTGLASRRGDDATTYRVTALYRYEFSGRSYEGTRVGIRDGFDNVSDWHHAQHHRLEAARISEQAVTAWVNPERPDQSVLDRGVRWTMIAFMIPFAILFPLVSLGAFAALVYLLKTPAATLDTPAKLDANPGEIRSDARAKSRGAWGFAIVWNLIAFPLAAVFVPTHFGRGFGWLLALVFPAVGVYLIVRAVRLSHSYRQWGETWVSLVPAQPAVGARVSVRVRFEKTPAPGDVTVALVCEEVDRRGDSTSHKALWRDDRIERAIASSFTASFTPPADLPASEPEAPIHHRWLVRLEFPEGEETERDFEVVLLKASGGAIGADFPRTTPSEQEFTGPRAPASTAIPASVATIAQDASGWTLAFKPTAGPGAAFVTAIVGLVVIGIAAYLFEENPFATVVVGPFGVLILAFALYVFRHRLDVQVDRSGVVTQSRGIFGVTRDEAAAGEVLELGAALRSNSYQVFARLKDGRRLDLSEAIAGTTVTQALIDFYRRHLGVKESAVISLDRAATADVVTPEERARGRKRLFWIVGGMMALMALAGIGPFIYSLLK